MGDDIEPIVLEVKYHKATERWNLVNSDLAIDVYGESFSEALDEVADSIKDLLIIFLEFDDSKLSSESIKIKKTLKKHLDFERYRDIFEANVGDEQ